MKVNHNCFRTVIFFLFFCTIASLHADIVNPDVVQTAARRWISANAIFKAEQPDAKPKDAIRMTDADGKQLPLWHVPLTPSGYLIMAADDTLPPVVAFDTKATFSKSSPTPLPAMLDKQGSIFQEALKEPQTRGNTIAQDNQLRWKRLLSPTRADSVMPFTIITPPMLETEWNQDSPYNILSPSYIDYDRRSVTGCVPIAIAQILKYHEWPIAGIGTQIYKDVNGHLRATLKADFSFPFEWNLIENNYAMTDETNITTSELAVARLAMEMGVLVNANYEPRGTGASINKIKNYLYLYLGYSKDAQHDYFTSQDPLSMQILYMRLHDDMASKRPALVAIPDHLFVADGLGTIDNLDYYHFNYGWGGSENGWYLLTDGYEETIVNGQPSINFSPKPFNDGEVIGVFGVCLFDDGGMLYETMSKAEVENCRKSSKSKNSPAWASHWGEMAKKTVIRRLCKGITLDMDADSREFFNAGTEIETDAAEIAKREIEENENKEELILDMEAADDIPSIDE